MNNLLKKTLCLGLGGVMLFAVGCGNNTPKPDPDNTDKTYDTETRNLQLSTGALDENFNPFFYTAANDGNMIANTQISMLTINEKGELVAGQNEPTVVLDYKSTMYDAKKVGEGNPTESGRDAANGRTEYEFVIKNGIKFSDGVDLTIADVLFNLYVYLDPFYTGSSTIYSTEIQGLKAYREQDPTLDDNSSASSDLKFQAEAMARIDAIADCAAGEREWTDEIKADLEAVKEVFRKELETDWNSVSTSWVETYKNTNNFQYAWQAYLYSEGVVNDQTKRSENGSLVKLFDDKNGNGVRDEDNNEYYYTTLDPDHTGAEVKDPVHAHYTEAVLEASTEEKVTAYMNANGATREYALEELQKQASIDIVFNNYTDNTNISQVLYYWQTGTTILEQFTNEQRSKYLEDQKEKGEGVKSISGISAYAETGANLNQSFKGTMNESYVDSETYSVLKIVINGVDPKAIYNFSFSVAPLHYYSTTDLNGKNCVNEAKEKVALAIENYGNPEFDDYYFGVESTDYFFKYVLQDATKNKLPKGAGPYMAANSGGNAATNGGDFCSNNIVHFMRNPYFETVGTGLSNAKIKYVDYKVLNDDQIMTALTTKSIDFGMPSGTSDNQTIISDNNSFLASTSYDTGGYGYVGINPKFVPEYQVRQAIMKALDTAQAAAHFGSSFAQPLYRPMTRTSWVYNYVNEDDPIFSEYPSVSYEVDDTAGNAVIAQLVKDAGYNLENGKLIKRTQIAKQGNASNGSELKLTFTIAGDTQDHPAFKMFNEAATRLNSLGFNITVKTDPQALLNLAGGNLAVWAAAWTSAIDPDPYQVYHKDSKATSVNNWNYPTILNNSSNWEYEYNIIQELSDLIDDGRSTIYENERAAIYVECLDLIMDLAVELPTYQRSDLCVYNKTVIDGNSLVKNPSYNMGLFDKLWEIDYV